MLHVFIFSSRIFSLSHEDVLKLVVLNEEHFCREKNLRELGWCRNYMMDKRENNDFMTDYVFINYSPNRRIINDQQPINDFELCNCYFCNSFFESLIRKN